MTRIILSFLVLLSLPASAASGLFLKTPPAAEAFLLRFSGDTTDSRATSYALQGLVNSVSAEVFIDQRTNDRAQIDSSGKPYTVLNTSLVGGSTSLRGVRTLFNRYHPSVQKMFIYDSAKDWTFYLALMAGAQQNGIPVTDTVRAALQAQVPGWAGTVVDYRNIGADRIEGYSWALANLMPNCTRKSVYFAGAFDLVCMDYVVASKSFVFNLSLSDPAQVAKITEIFATPGYGVGTSLGGYAGDSVNELANPYGIGYNVSNFYSNGSFWSSFPNKTYTQATGEAVTALNGKVYVAILISDGDNLQFAQGAIYSNWKNDPNRGTVPVGTSLPAVLQEMDTPLLDWYYANKTPNDELVAGPSGFQFIYLNDYNPALLPQWCEINAEWTAGAGFHTTSLWRGDFPSANYDVYTAMSGVDNIRHNRNLFPLSSNPQFSNGVPVFNERIRDCQNEQELYDDLAGVAANPSAPVFATGKLITARFGTTIFTSIKTVVDRLNADFPGKYVFQLPSDQAETAREYLQPKRSWNTSNGTWDTSTANWVKRLNGASLADTFTNNVDAVAFEDAGGVTGNPVITLNSTLSPKHVTMKSTLRDYTISGSGGIGGSTPLILDPANTGTLTLLNPNTYTGDTTINGGILALGTGGRLGNGSYAGRIRIAAGASLDCGTSNPQTLSGAITGAGTLRQINGSDLVLNGSAGNTINNLSITGGRVFINNANALTSSTTTTIGTNGLLNFGSTPAATGAITVQNNGGIATRDAAGTTLANVTLPGSGTAIFNNDDATTRDLTISSDQTLTGTLTVRVGGSRMTPTTAALGNVTLSGILGGGGGLAMTSSGNASNPLFGTGQVTLTGANTFSGATTISSGVLVLANSLALQNSALDTLNSIVGTSTAGLKTDLTSLTLGGLTGNKNLATVFTTTGGYSGLTALTLNPGPGVTHSYSADIGNGNGGMNLIKTGLGTQILSGANTHTGTTTITQGTLAFTTANASLAGNLTFGAADANTTTGALDLSAGSATFGGFVGQTNSVENNAITIGAGKTLTVAGNFTVGFDSAANTTTRLALTGLGTLSVNTGNFQVGGSITTNVGSAATLDMSGLANFSYNNSTGAFRVGDATNAGGGGTGSSTLILADTSTITAATLTTNSPAAQQQFIYVGSVENIINATTINIGLVGGRSTGGTLAFNEATGNLMIRGLTGGSSRANMTVGYGNATTGVTSAFNIVDLTGAGHSADLLLGTLQIAGRTNTTASGGSTAIFSFENGTMDATGVTVGLRAAVTTGTSTGAVDGSLNLGGGTVTIGATALTVASNSSSLAANTVNGTVNITGGAVNIGNTTTSITLGSNSNASNGGATAALNLTGGSLTVAGAISKGSTTGTLTSTLKLAGGTLDMGGKRIGAASAGAITFTAESGTLRNVASINGSGGLTKTTPGTLVLEGTNNYTGATAITEGTLVLGAANVLPDASAVSIAAATLDAATAGIEDAGTLAVTGTATINLAAGANIAFAASNGTWPGTLNLTGNFVSGSSLRFGNSSGLSFTQLGKISAEGFTGFALDASGYLTANIVFSKWITTDFTNGLVPEDQRGPYDDFDKDGIPNLIEFAIAGQDPTVPNATIGTFTGTTLSFTKRQGTSGLSYAIEESTDLGINDAWTEVTGVPPDYVNDGSTISYTLSPAAPGNHFLRLRVISN
jgi:autotransporter-associated beta strand protein